MGDFSRYLETISDGVAQLESLQAIGPSPVLEAATNDIRFGRDGLARILAAHRDELEQFNPDRLRLDPNLARRIASTQPPDEDDEPPF